MDSELKGLLKMILILILCALLGFLAGCSEGDIPPEDIHAEGVLFLGSSSHFRIYPDSIKFGSNLELP